VVPSGRWICPTCDPEGISSSATWQFRDEHTMSLSVIYIISIFITMSMSISIYLFIFYL